MALISRRDLQSIPLDWSAKQAALNEGRSHAATTTKFDVFLSHSYKDAAALTKDELLQIQQKLKRWGLMVYIDWIVDPELDRTDVTGITASVVRNRMNNSRSLLYATTQSSSDSKWMPWELGYVDGRTSHVAILPIIDTSSNGYNGQSYLGIYPHVAQLLNTTGVPTLFVIYDRYRYLELVEWINGATVPKRYEPGFW